MKKIIIFILSIFIFIPTNLYAATYKAKDMTIDFNDENWVVFTRDNIIDNENLNQLGITYDYMNNFFNQNNAYIDAVHLPVDENTLEAFVLLSDVGLSNNLHMYDEESLEAIGLALKEKANSETYEVLDINNYKIMHVSSIDNEYYLEDYYTIINGKGYTIKFQKKSKIEEIEEINKIINSIKFEIDEKYEKEETLITLVKKYAKLLIKTTAFKVGIVALTLIIVLIIALVIRNKKKEDKMFEEL